MKRNFSVLAFDLDDTALDEQKEFRQEVQDALCLVARHGGLLVPATGRVLSGIPQPILALPSVRYAITANGAKVHDLQNKTALCAHYFKKETALALVKELQEEPCFVSVFANDTSYTPTSSVDFLKDAVSPAVLLYLQNSRNFSADINTLIAGDEFPVEKIIANYASETLRNKIRAGLEQREDLCVSSSMGLNLEINVKEANKGSALHFLSRHLNIPLEQFMAAGDSDNDIQMLQTVGFSVAMDSAVDAVKQAANAVCPSASQSGLAHAIYQHFFSS